jgi:hypothetical protein
MILQFFYFQDSLIHRANACSCSKKRQCKKSGTLLIPFKLGRQDIYKDKNLSVPELAKLSSNRRSHAVTKDAVFSQVWPASPPFDSATF